MEKNLILQLFSSVLFREERAINNPFVGFTARAVRIEGRRAEDLV